MKQVQIEFRDIFDDVNTKHHEYTKNTGRVPKFLIVDNDTYGKICEYCRRFNDSGEAVAITEILGCCICIAKKEDTFEFAG